MKIKFVVNINTIVGGRYPFVIDTNKLPHSIGSEEITLKDFEIIKSNAPLTNQFSGHSNADCRQCGGSGWRPGERACPECNPEGSWRRI